MPGSVNQTTHNATMVDRVICHVTIIDPNHPLFDHTLPVVNTRGSHANAKLIVRLPTGEQRTLDRNATDLGSDHSATNEAPTSPLPISVRTLLPLAQHVRRLLDLIEERTNETRPDPTGTTTRSGKSQPRPAIEPLANPHAEPTATGGAGIGGTDPAHAPGASLHTHGK